MNQQTGIHGDKAHVEGGIHFHNYARTAQGIPLQRPPRAEHFKGRDDMLEELLPMLQPGKAVTLCGPGGMGKTALAVEAAWKLAPEDKPPASFPDGIIFYSFYGQAAVDPAFDHLVYSYTDAPPETGPAAAFRLLTNKRALIILDGAEEADDLTAVFRSCGGCGVLITTRDRLDARGTLVPVRPLKEQPAEQVFRLHSNTDADATTVQGICKLLDGWPLALRIAGQYLHSTVGDAAEYLEWLEEAPFEELGSGKHQNENAALLLERSMTRMSDDARLVLGAGGCLAFHSLAREPMAALLDGNKRRAGKALGLLVNFGLLERQGKRWKISHALIHTYARKHLPLSKAALERVAAYYREWCREQSAAGVPGYVLLDDERAHCLRLIAACLDGELWQEVQGLVGAIDIYLERQGYWTEELAALEMRLTAARKAEDRRDEAWCLHTLGYTCWKRGENEEALAWYEQSLAIKRELGEKKGQAPTLDGIAIIYQIQGKYELALELYEQSLSIRREVGDREGEGVTLNNIGRLYRAQGDNETALPYYEQSLPIRREVGDTIGEGTTLNNIANIYYAQGKYSKAAEYHEQALAIRQELGDRAGEAESCWNLGTTYYDMGDLAKAEEYIALAVEIMEAIHHPNLETCRDGLELLRAERQM
ncbi:MAG: tetratricopeptide repeat protein [Candidatus Electrothrix aestuarii]|uniref:Tetratricopeptide repeat protein n=1 Tax=Candidatus Electrothrix aestuarii TaxID=3062594 RepID=A0AAU8M0K4_9BACT|nr:tetratricopeptide repeat protein [Candidatus Electrothrix aestuarii]